MITAFIQECMIGDHGLGKWGEGGGGWVGGKEGEQERREGGGGGERVQ